VFAVARDITERRRVDQERFVTGKLESAGILAGGLAHDFNNLLTSLSLNLEMLPCCGPTTRDQQQHLQQAHFALNSAKALTDQLIALVDGGVVKRKVCDLRETLRASMDLALAGSGIRGECRLADGLCLVKVDEARIAQVVRGLMMNARDATPAGGEIRLEAENVSLPAGAAGVPGPGEWVRIRIVDSGSGIPPDVLPKVFDPYFSTKQRGAQKGMGLGLTTCRVILREHGGAIAIESDAARGATVTCHLPAWREGSAVSDSAAGII
jgi:signal transduction histidine kinase